jgi:hypothetical protein
MPQKSQPKKATAKPKVKLTAKMGAVVQYCGHDGVFIADIFVIEGVAAVRANGPITTDNLVRNGKLGPATHHLVDFPIAGSLASQSGHLRGAA